MRRLTFLFLFLNAAVLQAQKLSDEPVLIHYPMFLSLSDQEIDAQKPRPQMARMITSFNPSELEKYNMVFIEHVRAMRSVDNYVGPLGHILPTTLLNWFPKQTVDYLKNDQLIKVGKYYLPPKSEIEPLIMKEKMIAGNTSYPLDENLKNIRRDTFLTENLETGELEEAIVEVSFDYAEEAVGTSFTEYWNFDSDKGIFEKTPLYVGSMIKSLDGLTGEFRGFEPVFNFNVEEANRRTIKDENLIKENVEYEVLFKGIDQLKKEEDCMDYRKLLNDPDPSGYISVYERSELIAKILKSAKEGQVKVLDYNGINSDFTELETISAESFFDRLIITDTAMTEDLETGELQQIIIQIAISTNDICGFRFIEDWYFDSKNMAMYKRVKAIVPMIYVRDNITGEVRGLKPFGGAMFKLNTKW